MARTYLDAIVARHRERAAADGRDWRARAEHLRATGASLADSLRAGDCVAVIAEVKRRSPSLGWIDEGLDAAAVARDYERGGAAAVSVLTDEEGFGGSAADLVAVRAAVALPVLRKDFTVAENDVLDAVEMGASAVLLIVAALSARELASLHELAGRVGLEALVEVHDEEEARAALDVGARLVGVNQRDLHSFEVDVARAARVAKVLPDDVVRVAESGLRRATDVEGAARAGFDAVLVGETLVRSGDRAAAVAELAGVVRGRRG